jgi:F-type H+-transporting ATPase subunit delta
MRTGREARRDATRLWRLCLVHGRVDPVRIGLVVDRLIETGGARAAVLLSQVMRLVRLEEAKRAARVESAAPLEAGERKTIEDGLTRRYGRAFETTFAVEPALIGGMRLRAGSDVFDGSIRGRLAALAARFDSDPGPAIPEPGRIPDPESRIPAEGHP